MGMKHIALMASLLAPLALLASAAAAEDEHHHDDDQEYRQYGVHVHGIARLNLALEGEELHVELDSPAANIVGFEHAPSSEADHAVLEKALATLKNGDELFLFNEAAGCRMEKSMVSSGLFEEEHDDHDKEAEHAHEKHAHDEHEGEETHSDIDAVYHFECDQPGKLTQVSVELFEAFPGTEKLNTQYVVESKQGAMELTAEHHLLKF